MFSFGYKIRLVVLLTPLPPKMHALGGVWTLSLKSALRLCAPHVRSADSSRRETAENARVYEQRPSRSRATRE